MRKVKLVELKEDVWFTLSELKWDYHCKTFDAVIRCLLTKAGVEGYEEDIEG